MTYRITPYLSFPGNARDAMNFYRDVFGGELEIVTAADLDPTSTTGGGGLVAHASLQSASGLALMGADASEQSRHGGCANVSLALGGDDLTEISRHWDQLIEGGAVSVPLATSAWGTTFGRCTDKYGTAWLVNISAPAEGELPRA